MSRFYEALKEASRLPAKEKLSKAEAPQSEPVDLSDVSNHIDLPPVAEDWDRSGAMPTLASVPKAGAEAAAKPSIASVEDELLFPIPATQPEALGTVAAVSLDQSAKVLPQTINPSILEYYRRLRTKILQEQTAKPFRTLLIASPNPKDGKTVTTLNLGYSFAMLPSFRVLLVDGDLRKGSLGKLLGLDDRPGFQNLLDGSAKLEDVVLKTDDNPLHFIVRGNSKGPAAELLNASELRKHFRHMAEYFDLILVDSPPVNLITDTQLLASECDAVLLVARAFATSRKSFEKAVEEMQRFRVLGAVLNGGIRPRRNRQYYGYYGEAK